MTLGDLIREHRRLLMAVWEASRDDLPEDAYETPDGVDIFELADFQGRRLCRALGKCGKVWLRVPDHRGEDRVLILYVDDFGLRMAECGDREPPGVPHADLVEVADLEDDEARS